MEMVKTGLADVFGICLAESHIGFWLDHLWHTDSVTLQHSSLCFMSVNVFVYI